MHNDSTPENITPFAAAKPDWNAWKDAKRAPLWKAMALLLNIEPEHVTILGENLLLSRQLDQMPEFFRELDKAITAVEIGHLRSYSEKHPNTETAEVDLAEFAQWAGTKGYSIPLEFPRRNTASTAPIYGWPWGAYDTKLLRDLAAAANKWWKNYDPTDPSTAPNNDEVSNWLQRELQVAKRNAEIMATILRADGLPTGPRK